MELDLALIIVAVGIPLVAANHLWSKDAEISERHHTHHVTYVIGRRLTWSLVLAMIFMGALGVLLGWLCMVGVFEVDPSVPLCFFDAYLVVSFVYWWLLRRYKVVTYDDHMEVTPFVGGKSTISYRQISAMEWRRSIVIRNGRNVRVFVGNRNKALLWSALDLDQILIRINRFDALAEVPTKR
ncbi:MAG: hypothetical protein J6S63_04120 [Atopobiaceae bacterium]|nr:hypothetical protein [Atopobiaceae bacterium]